ncbi:MAG: dephospho-CoA kinase [Chloroflexota bacterium]|nr:dephospho-CoA kinase [Chloroflexota bacterium]MEA2607523.1 dephospho-CoA kinase [Chloroflexota bacterium]
MTETGPPGRRTVRIGLTGPIGCGKSTIAGWLADRGAIVVDADLIAREVSAPGEPAHDAVVAAFGDGVRLDGGRLDRAALARVVFADPDALQRLEAIVQPAVRIRILAIIAEADGSGAPAVVVEAIKLVEGGLAALCDETWLVTCAPSVQRDRVLARGATTEDADRRIAAQAGLVERVRPVATRVIDTSGPLVDARSRVAAAWDAALSGH